MKQRNEFMLVFRFEPNFDYQPSLVEMATMHQQWGAYIGKIAIQEKLVSTYQLGFDGVQINANHAELPGIHIANNQTLGGNMVIKAETMGEAVEIGKNCPILSMGGTVEVRSIQSM